MIANQTMPGEEFPFFSGHFCGHTPRDERIELSKTTMEGIV